jgi:hypothetical protein
MIETFFYYQKKKKVLSSANPINKDFPVDKLIKIFKPYLYVFFQSKYSLVDINKNNNYNKFIYQMNNFWKFNPKFGRKYIYVKTQFQLNYKKPLRITDYLFDDKHIKYNDNNMQSGDSNILSVNHIGSNIRNNNSLLINSLLQINLQPAYEEEEDEEDDEEEEDSLS